MFYFFTFIKDFCQVNYGGAVVMPHLNGVGATLVAF